MAGSIFLYIIHMKFSVIYQWMLLLAIFAAGADSYGRNPERSSGKEQAVPIWEMETDAVLKQNRQLPDYNKLQALTKGNKGVTWVITGDSITHGAMHTHSMRSYPEHWGEMRRWDHRRYDDVIINTGISGDRIGGILKKFDERVMRFKPEVVSINIGMNDCSAGRNGIPQFKQGLAEAVKKIRSLGAIPVLQVPSLTNDDQGQKGQQLFDYSEAVREVAGREKVLLVDHEAHWKKFANTPEKRKAWMNDAIHPNGLGHQEMFKKMAYDLGFLDPSKPTSKIGDKTL